MKNARPAEAVPSVKAHAHFTAARQEAFPGFEPLPLAPIMPAPNTRPAEALAMLIEREHIDQREFLDVQGGWRLAAAVHILRALGWRIETEHVPVVLDNGEQAHIARYRLDRSNLPRQQAGRVTVEGLLWWLAFANVLAVVLTFGSRWFA